MAIEAGNILIATNELMDSNFFRTVVLLFQYDSDGAAGLVLNRPLNLGLAQVWHDVAQKTCPSDQNLYWGGPVEGPLMVLHSRLMLAEIPIMAKVFLSTQRDSIDEVLTEAAPPFRAFSGYAGWGAGQLDQEVALGGWFVMPGDVDFVFGEPSSQWRRACQRLGEQVMYQYNQTPPIGDSANN